MSLFRSQSFKFFFKKVSLIKIWGKSTDQTKKDAMEMSWVQMRKPGEWDVDVANCNHHPIRPFRQGNKIIAFLQYTKESRSEGTKTLTLPAAPRLVSNERLTSTKKT